MVYGRYNYSTIVNGDSFMVYKPTNITVGPILLVVDPSAQRMKNPSYISGLIPTYYPIYTWNIYVYIYKYSRHIPCKGVQVYYVTYVIYMPFSIANC